MDVFNNDVEYFHKQFHVDEDGVWAVYKEAPCKICGKHTTRCDATTLWVGVHTPLCSDKCMNKFWALLEGF